jgi:predicted transcriptional regulator of viral defense system
MTQNQGFRALDSAFQALRGQANANGGIFTTRMAEDLGISRALLAHHEKSGRISRGDRGVYRFGDNPPGYLEYFRDHAAALGPTAVFSHETALSLHELSDVSPRYIHATVPRSRRFVRRSPSYKIHTVVAPLPMSDVVEVHGVRATSPARSIVDAARSLTAPEQIEMAVEQALERGIATPEQFDRIVHATRANPYMRDVLLRVISRFVSRSRERDQKPERGEESIMANAISATKR